MVPDTLSEANLAEVKQALLDCPGMSIAKQAERLGLLTHTVQRLAKDWGLGTESARLAAAGRSCVFRPDIYDRVPRSVVLRPGRLLHFDAACIGRISYGRGRHCDELVVYSMVDRCSSYCWSFACDRISPENAAAALLTFAASSPIDLAGGLLVTDGRFDVVSSAFEAAVSGVGLVRRGLAGGSPTTNSVVEQHHRYVRYRGFAALPFDRIRTMAAAREFLATFTAELNTDRSLVFSQCLIVSPLEVVRGMAKFADRPAIERARICRLLTEHELLTARPATIDQGSGHLFVQLADALSDNDRLSIGLDALLVDRSFKNLRRDGRRKSREQIKVPPVPGLYICA